MKKLALICIGAALATFFTGCDKKAPVTAEITPSAASEAYFTSGVDVPAAGQILSVSFSSALAWEAMTDVKWIKVTPASDGAGDASVSVVVEANNDLTARKGHVTVNSDNLVKTIEVRQAARAEIGVQSVDIDGNDEITIAEKATFQLTYKINPENADVKSVQWSSSSEENATVSQTGLVTAIKEGSAVITLDVDGKTDQVTVIIPHTHVAVTSVTLNETKLSLEATVGSFQLTATVRPENADYDGVVWSVSPADIVSVEDGLVTALKEGTAVVTATAGEGSASCTVTVTPYINNGGQDLNDPIDIQPW